MVVRRLIAGSALLVTLVAATPALASTGDELAMSRQLQGQMNRVARQQHDRTFHAIATRCQRTSKALFLCEVKTDEPATYGVRVVIGPTGNVGWRLVAQLS
ncbi:MAG: hypothetical protein ABI317_10240 [Gaiellales bacterium]